MEKELNRKIKVGDSVIRIRETGQKLIYGQVYTCSYIGNGEIKLTEVDGIWYTMYFKKAITLISLLNETRI